MLSKFIKYLRKKHNLTQEFLAAELSISRPTFVQIEQNSRDLTISEAKKLSEIFGMTLDNFLQKREQPAVTINISKAKAKKTNQKTKELRVNIPQQKVDKFKHVLLYILKKVGGKPNVGMTVIYKLLYFIDFDYYEKYEEQLMGLAYIKNHHGPTPILFKRLVEQMIKNNEAEMIKSKFYHFPQTKFLINPAIEPNLTILNGQEKEHIDWELQRLSDLTATELSLLSHKDVPWISAETGNQLDYESVFYRTELTSVRDYSNEKD